MCDAAAIELARLELSFVAQAVREEMLYPALTTAVASRSVNLWAEVSIQGRKPGTPSGRRSTKWIDFVLHARSSRDGAFATALPVEVKIAKHKGDKIAFQSDQLLAESAWRLPDHVPGDRLEGCLLVVVLRVAKDDAIATAREDLPSSFAKRLPRPLRQKPVVARSSFCGDTCSTTAMAFWFSKAELTKGAAKSKNSKVRAGRAKKGAAA